MPTIDGGFRTGDKVTPEDFNNSASQGVICTVVFEDGRHTMKVEFPEGYQQWVHPYRWKKATIVATTPNATTPNAGEQSLYNRNCGIQGSFETALWEALECADSTNLDALAKGFPEHVAALRNFRHFAGYWPNLVARVEGRV